MHNYNMAGAECFASFAILACSIGTLFATAWYKNRKEAGRLRDMPRKKTKSSSRKEQLTEQLI
jgi:hypothetical protein